MTDNDDARAERGRQIRDARALLGWSQVRLASLAELTVTDVIHLERGTVGGHQHALEAVRRVIEDAGIDFLSDGQSSPEGGSGVRLRKTP